MLVAPFMLTLALLPQQVAIPAPPAPLVVQLRGGGFGFIQGVPNVGGLPTVPAAPGLSGNADLVGGPADETVLKNANLLTTDEALLQFFRRRTPPAPSREKIEALVKQLNAEDLGQRDTAQAELTAIGQAAVPALRTAANNVDQIEGSTRARVCLQNIESSTASNLVIHSARLLAQRKPVGAAEALIGYLPFAEDDATFREVEHALLAVSFREGKPDPAILQALTDKLAIRRGTAAQVICQAGGKAYHAAVRPLLKDERPSVRLRAALGLVGAYDSEAIPVLIDLLAELQPSLRVQAEDFLTQLAGEWAVAGPRGNDLMSRQLRRDVWAAWWKNTDGERLLSEFRSRSISDDDLLKATALIAKLTEDNLSSREATMNELVRMGRSAVPLLRRAVNDGDEKIAPLAARCLDAIDKDIPPAMPAAAPRLLGLRKPAGTVDALLQYLPCCESAALADQLTDILSALGCQSGKADEALLKALDSKVPMRRALAVLALCRGKATADLPAIRRMLKDPDLAVQLRAAQGLASLGEKEAIPTLITLMKELPLDQAWEIEDYLIDLAGDKPPVETLSTDPASRERSVAAWNKWWEENNRSVVLNGSASRRELGLYLMIENFNQLLSRGRVLEADSSGKIRWEIRNLNWPNDAQLLRNGNLLIIEQQNRVTERDKTGKIVGFDKNFPNVFHVERLRDGSTFIACRNQLIILDPKGATTLNYNYTANTILAAKRFRDGTIAFVSYGGQFIKLDRSGNVIKTAQFANWGTLSPNGAEILSGDRLVLADGRFNKVLEFGLDGKPLWECSVNSPLSPTVTSNGNILVAGNGNNSIYEINRQGKIVKDWSGFEFRPFRVFRR